MRAKGRLQLNRALGRILSLRDALRRMEKSWGKGLTLQAICGPALSFGVPKLRRSRWCRGPLGWSEKGGIGSLRDAVSVDGGIGGGTGLGFDRCAASCSAGSTATPRAGEMVDRRESFESPASCPLLPLCDGRGFAHVTCDRRSLFALWDEGRRGNFNDGERKWRRLGIRGRSDLRRLGREPAFPLILPPPP